jgi:hypothetical protein
MMSATADPEDELISDIGSFTHDPLAFVLYIYPWGSGELKDSPGPRQWQRDALNEIGERLRAGYAPGAALMPVLMARASGHGIGKSALVAWITHWALSTCEDSRVVITANTQAQLTTKTWPELAKWLRHAINRHWFELQAMSITATDESHAKIWRCDAVTWSLTNLEAFAGLHNEGKRIVLLFDEGSGIHDRVWEVAEGALTDERTEIIWCAFGNPTEPSGRFAACFGAQRYRWRGQQIDSRTVPGTNKQLHDEWAALYGEDSDFFRVRVRGMFPRSGSMQFIPSEDIDQASEREAVANLTDPFVMGVDVARFGADESVIYFRKGRDGRTHLPLKFRGIDNMQLAGRVAEEFHRYSADAVFVDGGGTGTGVVDRLRMLRIPVFDIQFGAKADRVSFSEERPGYANKRAEMWGNMREWLKGGAIPKDPDLMKQLAGPQYAYVIVGGRDVIQLERKEDMARRDLESPDIADALALTFAYPVQPAAMSGGVGNRPRVQVAYDPFGGV